MIVTVFTHFKFWLPFAISVLSIWFHKSESKLSIAAKKVIKQYSKFKPALFQRKIKRKNFSSEVNFILDLSCNLLRMNLAR